MYEAFYGLREKPFALSPDPRYLFLAESHREALAHLLYGIEQGEGFIAITGEVGTGKTTLCRTLLRRLGGETEVAFIFNPELSAFELLQSICHELGIPVEGRSRRELMTQLNEFLLARRREGRRVLLIVDEAQNLSPEALEEIRLLSNLETETSKLIQILLLGQPELDEKLESPELRQLKQRITVRWKLRPLSARETRDYVRHRLRVAAGAERELFTEAALREIHLRTGGIPRLVNVLCDRALVAGYGAGDRSIGIGLVSEAAREVGGPSRRSLVDWTRHLRPAAGMALLLGLGAVAGFLVATGGAGIPELRFAGGRGAPALPPVASPAPVRAPAPRVEPAAPPPPAAASEEPGASGSGAVRVPPPGGGVDPAASGAPLAPAPEPVAPGEAAPGSVVPDGGTASSSPAGPSPVPGTAVPEAGAAPSASVPAGPNPAPGAGAAQAAAAPSTPAPPDPSPAPAPGSRLSASELDAWLRAASPADTAAWAVDALLERWGLPPAALGSASVREAFLALRSRGLSILRVQGADLAFLRALDHAAIVPVQLPGAAPRYLTLAGLGRREARIAGLAPGREVRISESALAGRMSDEVFLVWRDFEALPELIAAGQRGPAVRWLQETLAELGYYAAPVTGVFDAVTAAAVRRFQADRGLLPDGAVGPLTKMALYGASGRYGVPRLSTGRALS